MFRGISEVRERRLGMPRKEPKRDSESDIYSAGGLCMLPGMYLNKACVRDTDMFSMMMSLPAARPNVKAWS